MFFYILLPPIVSSPNNCLPQQEPQKEYCNDERHTNEERNTHSYKNQRKHRITKMSS